MNNLYTLLVGLRNRFNPVPIVAVGLVIFWGVVLFRPVSDPAPNPPTTTKPPTVAVQRANDETTGQTAGVSTDTPSDEVVNDELAASTSEQGDYSPNEFYPEPATEPATAPAVSQTASNAPDPQASAASPQPAVTPPPAAPPQDQPTSPAQPEQPPQQLARITTTVFSLVCSSIGVCL